MIFNQDRLVSTERPSVFSNEGYCIRVKKFKNIWIYRINKLGEHLLQRRILYLTEVCFPWFFKSQLPRSVVLNPSCTLELPGEILF